MDVWSLMRGDAFIHFVCGSRRVNIRLGVLLLIPKSPQKQKKKVFVIELTVPFEENFDWAHQRKLEKYEDLREQCVRNGWITKVFPIEVGCRGFIVNSTSVFLTNPGLPPSEKRKYPEKVQDKALTASAWIWQSYRATTI